MYAKSESRVAGLIAAIAVFLVGTATAAHGQTPAQAIEQAQAQAQAQAQGATGAPAATAAPGAAAPRQSDTIGEAADRQRTLRMMQSQARAPMAGQAQAQGPGGIAVVPAMQAGAQFASAPGRTHAAESDMVLTEVLLGPVKDLVAIDVLGVVRRVGVGAELGNGWRVHAIHSFSVDLVPSKGDAAAKNAKSKAKPKVTTLTLKTGGMGVGMNSQPAPAPTR